EEGTKRRLMYELRKQGKLTELLVSGDRCSSRSFVAARTLQRLKYATAVIVEKQWVCRGESLVTIAGPL
ncbi:hypothetical protein HAX54_013699, partial [Datura stramonium]|nr:hypothetical protein [Datura stramonium]